MIKKERKKGGRGGGDGEKEKKKEFRLDSSDFGLICAGVSNVGCY